MPVIALVNQKGGVSKSTTAVHFAYWLKVKKRLKVCLVDADTQQSSSKWLQVLEVDIPFWIINKNDELLEKIPFLQQDFEYVIIDAPAGLPDSIRSILLRADLALVPCQPTKMDLDSAADAIKEVRQIQSVRNGLPRCGMFLARAVKGTKLLSDALSLLSKIENDNIVYLKTIIYQKQVIPDSTSQETVVWEMPKTEASTAARLDFEKLFKEALRLIA